MSHHPPRRNYMEIKIIKTATCPSISGKSTLTYQVGKAGTETQIRIQENSGAGRFSNEWLSLKAIGKTPFTSAKLKELIKGKSINTSAFILAVLLNEELIKPSKTEKGSYVLVDKPKTKPAQPTKKVIKK